MLHASPRQSGSASHCATVARGHRLEQHVRRRPDQCDTVLPRLRQQDGQIVIDQRRLDDASFQIAAQPFAELQLASRRMTPRHHVVVRDDGDLQRAHATAATGRRRRAEQVRQQCASHRFVRAHRDRHQQIDVAARFQAAVERRSEQMDRLQRRTEVPFDHGARGGELCGDVVRNEARHDDKPGAARPTEREETPPGQRHRARRLPRSRFADDVERFALPHRHRHASRERSSPLGDGDADARHTIRRVPRVRQPVIATPPVRYRALCAAQ